MMNIYMKTVKMTVRGRGDAVALDTMTVRGSTIRLVLLPDALPLETLLIDDRPKVRKSTRGSSARGRGGRGRGRGRGGWRGRRR